MGIRPLIALLTFVFLNGFLFNATAQEKAVLTVQTARPKQVFEGMGAGAVLFEGHITSLAARNKPDLQEKLYDDLFGKVKTKYLQLLIRETHEPQNDNADPYLPAFDEKNFEYCKHTIAIAKAAQKRQPDLQLFATLHTPPSWMKTNSEPTGGGESRASLKPGLDLELAEYVWAFCAHMQKNGVPIQYLSICNEPDWPHTQPSYFLTAPKHAVLFKTVGEYFEKMAKKFPDVPRPKLVGPNTLSAPGAIKDYLPLVFKDSAKYLDVIGCHDYDPRGDRWGTLRKLADKKPVWMTEWCARKKDPSPGMIESALEYGKSLHEVFTGGANVYMAYDWVYPPRDSGEGLIHVNWGNDYSLTKPYFLFRQWCEPLKPGMHLVDIAMTGKGTDLKPTAFLAPDGKSLAIHIVNAGDKDVAIALKLTGKLSSASSAKRMRTSATEDAVELPDATGMSGTITDTIPAKSFVTYRVESTAK